MKRTLKKTLALVLSLVLALGLMAMGANAINDSGKVSKGYEEAVDVFVGLGLVKGDENGNFNPQSTFTREAAAKIICMMTYGVKEADLLKCSSDPFKDVKANRWSAGYISYCVSKGYIAGMGDGTFNPEGTITGYGFAKLLLCALGYDAKEEKLEGSEWEINTATLAQKIGLFKGNEDGKLNEAATREQCALYALNTLTADMVEYVGGTHVTVGGTTITTGATRQVVAGSSSENYDDETTGDSKMQFCERQFPKLKLDAEGTDDLGRTARIWSLDGKDIATGAQKATYSFTAKESAAAAASAANVLAGIKTATKNSKLTLSTDPAATFALNGDATVTAAAITLEAGDQVEVFAEKNVISSVVVIRSTLVKVTNVKALTAAQIKANANNDDPKVVAATSTVSLAKPDGTAVLNAGDAKKYNTQIPGFNYEKDDHILVVLAADGKSVLASEAAKTVEGTVDATKGSEYRINGTFYAKTSDVTISAIGVTGKWALDAAGKLGATIDVTVASSDYAYVYSIGKAAGSNVDGVAGSAIYTVYAVNQNGEKIAATAALTKGATTLKGGTLDFAADTITYTDGIASAGFTPFVTAYSINANGEFEAATATDTIATSAVNADVNKNAAAIGSNYATNNTKFVFVKIDGKTLKISTATGYKSVNIANSSDIIPVSNANKQVTVAFVADTANGVEDPTTTLAVLLNATPVVTKDSKGNDSYAYSVAVDGVVKEVVSSAAIAAIGSTVTAGDAFTYVTDANGAVTATKVDNANTVTFASGSQIELGTAINSVKTFDISDVALYTITVDNTNNGAVSVEKGATLTGDEGAAVNVNLYTTGSGAAEKIVAIFVTNTISA